MLTVACVLRSGGEYLPHHVVRLREGVRRWLEQPFRFVCLADTPIPEVNCVLLRHDWPRWWAKLELFRPGVLSGRVLYLDLDTDIVGPLDDLVDGHRFTVLRNFWTETGTRIGSGLMAWNCDLSPLYETFRGHARDFMNLPQTPDNLGDQGFIQRHSPVPMDRWQDRFPGRVVSFRRHCTRGVPPGASIVCYGGPVRPWSRDGGR
ncbi:hypothetical protein [Alsobacter sp. R-9]